ncbi:MAG: hypothetical protein ACTSQE_11190 [Candidatus Heimdallarchaeaceae archaeon]
MLKEFRLYFDDVLVDDDNLIDQLISLLSSTFDLKVRVVGVRIPPHHAWTEEKQAFQARLLMNSIVNDGINFFLWLINKKIFVEDRSSFGYAERRVGAILSVDGLYQKPMLIANEALYLTGIVLGLTPCLSDCLMKKVETLDELLQKPNKLCKTCSLKYLKIK